MEALQSAAAAGACAQLTSCYHARVCLCACARASRCTATVAFCYWECSRPTYKPGRTDSKARRLANTPSLNRFATFWFGVYLAAWALLIFLLLLDDVVKADEAAFNPFEILGVEVRRSLSPGLASAVPLPLVLTSCDDGTDLTSVPFTSADPSATPPSQEGAEEDQIKKAYREKSKTWYVRDVL